MRILALVLIIVLLGLPAAAHDLGDDRSALCSLEAAEYSEDEFIFDYERAFMDHLYGVSVALGSGNAENPHYDWSKSASLPHVWTERQWTGHARGVTRVAVHFNAFGYFKGVPTVGESTTFDLSSDSDPDIQTFPSEAVTVNETIKTTVEESRTVEDTYTSDHSFDVTAKQDASVTAGFKAGTAGVEASASATVSVGFEEGYSKSFGKSNSDSVTKTETKELETAVSVPSDARKIILTIQKKHTRVVTEVVENGYLDFSGKIVLGREALKNAKWLVGSIADSGHGDLEIEFVNAQHLLDIFEGREPREYPGMAGFMDWASANWDKVGVQNNWHAHAVLGFHSWFSNPENRHVCLHREQVVESRNAGEIDVTYG